MSVRPPHEPDVFLSDVDYDVYDLDDLQRSPGGTRPYAPLTGPRGPRRPDTRLLVPLLVAVAAVLLIFLALNSRGGDDGTEQGTPLAGDMSELAQRVHDAELRAGFDGLTVSEQDGTIVIEGQATDPTTAASIGAVARSVEGTQLVDNRVVVQGGVVDNAAANTVVPDNSVTLTEQLGGIGNITFEVGSADITNEGSVAVDSAAAFLSQDPGARIEIHGHTDSDGEAETNQVLSQQRAEAVLTALVARGIDPTRMTAVGFGESQPIAPNVTDDGRATNRRIEFLVLR